MLLAGGGGGKGKKKTVTCISACSSLVSILGIHVLIVVRAQNHGYSAYHLFHYCDIRISPLSYLSLPEGFHHRLSPF